MNIYIKIIMPSVICTLFLSIKSIEDIQYSILLFGFVIGVFNRNVHKYEMDLGAFLSILVSCISYGLGMLSYFGALYLIDFFNFETMLNKEIGGVFLLLSSVVIAPLLLFNLYKFVFKIPKTKNTNWIIIISIILLVVLSQFFTFKDSKTDDVYRIFFIIWQVIMALALQLILYQKELKVYFSKTKH
jgi:hypothetical protein